MTHNTVIIAKLKVLFYINLCTDEKVFNYFNDFNNYEYDVLWVSG